MNSAHARIFTFIVILLEVRGTSGDWSDIGGTWYRIVEDLQSWQSSGAQCQALGGNLYSAFNQTDEEAVVLSLLQSAAIGNGFWIGLSDTAQEGQFRWSDNSSSNYRNFDASDPTRNNSCVYLRKNEASSSWFRENCSTQLWSICESASPEMTTPLPEQTQGKVTSPTGVYCPSDWTQVNDSCYLVFGWSEGSRKNWTEAQDSCIAQNATLATIHSQAAQSLIVAELLLANKANVWIGLSADSGENFQWIDDSSLDFQKWARGEPDGSSQQRRCVELLNNEDETGRWNDDDCSYLGGYACQMPADISNYHTTGPIIDLCVRPGYVPYRDSCFHVDLHPRNFSEGEAFCDESLAHLASVVDGYEEAFIESLFFQNDLESAWIGLTDAQEEGSYKWTDGWPVWYTNWGHNEPSRAVGEGCVALTSDGSWDDTACWELRSSICKYTADVKPTEPAIAPGYCPEGWTAYNSSCYIVQSDTDGGAPTDWQAANAACQLVNSELASIHSKQENEFLRGITQPTNMSDFWFGLYRNDQGGFSWTDFSPVGYDNWGNREPSHTSDHDCGMFSPVFGQWSVKNCTTTTGFICKGKKLPSTTTPRPSTLTASETTVPVATLPSSLASTNQTLMTSDLMTSSEQPSTSIAENGTTQASTTKNMEQTSPSQSMASTTDEGACCPQDGMSTGAIVGICISCAVFLAVATILAIAVAKGRITVCRDSSSSTSAAFYSIDEHITISDKKPIL